MARATTVRFTDAMYARMDQASAATGLPVNSIVIAACLDWLERHGSTEGGVPRRSSIARAITNASGKVRAALVSAGYPFERLTPFAKESLTQAHAEAEETGKSYVGTEHLLLGLLRVPASRAGRVLAALGVEENVAREKVAVALKGPAGAAVVGGTIMPTTRVKKIIEMAFKLSLARHEERVGTHHILLAISNEGEGVAAYVLNDLGASFEQIQQEVEKLGDEPEA